MLRYYYTDSIDLFLQKPEHYILGQVAEMNQFSLIETQKKAWIEQIVILKDILKGYTGKVFFEYSIPRMGQRIDVVLIIQSVIFVLEFKVGEEEFHSYAVDQVMDYALDLKNFHESSHDHYIAPILIATNASMVDSYLSIMTYHDKLLKPIRCNVEILERVIRQVIEFCEGSLIDLQQWEKGRYSPTPTIIEAAMALYNNHSVIEITRSDAGARNLTETSNELASIILDSKKNSQKSICFVTGVPGAGKTLVGLHVATTHINIDSELHSVFLSGNGPLVSILREALARDKVLRVRDKGGKIRKGEVLSEVKLFIQNVHHFRDDCLLDKELPPLEHVAIFDEAQRAWNLDQTKNFMARKKRIPDFNFSEPDFLISCLDRHRDWAVIICLVGGGQEINTGEAGISEWITALEKRYENWRVYLSSQLHDKEYLSQEVIDKLKINTSVFHREKLHLAVSMRSFRAENVSLFVKYMLDIEPYNANKVLSEIIGKYPIVLTRKVSDAKRWLKEQSRGSERYGLVVSSQAERLKPFAIDVKSPMNPINWFLEDKSDVRSSYYLEHVASEFDIQGLELDWVCVTWDADFRYTSSGWSNWSFKGKKWQRINKPDRKKYQLNAYRVLLTRARQGMVIVVPEGDPYDHTRKPEFYDATYAYLVSLGIPKI